MLTCKKCKVTVTGDSSLCPLCQGDLAGAPQERSAFPRVESIRKRHRTLLNLAVFLSIITAAVCVVINLSYRRGGWWSLFVAAGIASLWLTFWVVMQKRGNIPKSILSQVTVISVLAVAWDFSTGFHLWSLDFVVPILCTCAMGAMAIMARILKLQIEDYIMYLVLDCVLGIIPLAFILLDILHVVLPSVICVAASLVFFSALLAFEGRALLAELRRRMHL